MDDERLWAKNLEMKNQKQEIDQILDRYNNSKLSIAQAKKSLLNKEILAF